jgi:hypothetical protein
MKLKRIAISEKNHDSTNIKNSKEKRFLIMQDEDGEKYQLIIEHFRDSGDFKKSVLFLESDLSLVFYEFFRCCMQFKLGFKLYHKRGSFPNEERFYISEDLMNKEIARYHYRLLKSTVLNNEDPKKGRNDKWFYYAN